jgi:trehalose synthase
MSQLYEVAVGRQDLERFREVADPEVVKRAEEAAGVLRALLANRVVWNINSTAVGGGVAEMLRPLIGYARGAGVDSRWLVISGSPEFFTVTKRLHHALHGASGDGSPLDAHARDIYEQTLRMNAHELDARVRAGDIAVLHDPQTLGLAPHLQKCGLRVIWRCHIGYDQSNSEVEDGWAFLAPYLQHVHAFVFSRSAYIPPVCDRERSSVIAPSIDVFSAKNQELDEETVRSILVHVGLLEGPRPSGSPSFRRGDGTPGRVERCVDLVRNGPAPALDAPLVVQVSRWDQLKDPVGVVRGFARLNDRVPEAHLVLAGPNVHAVADDPEADAVFLETLTAWRALPHATRSRITLASLPTADVEENAAIVNALQRHSAVIVQKSLHEGFGLTVTEGMWKGRPVLASAVGGIQDQIEDGVNGLLLDDPQDPDRFAATLSRILHDAELAARLGEAARETVRERYLGVRHLLEYAELLAKLDAS